MNSFNIKYLKYKNKYLKIKKQIGGMREAIVKHKSSGKLLRIQFPDSFFCPLSNTLFEEPVVSSDGITYEKSHLLQKFGPSHKTIPNIMMKLHIEDFIEDAYKKKLFVEVTDAPSGKMAARHEPSPAGAAASQMPSSSESSDVESVDSQQSFEDECQRILQVSGLLAEELNFAFAPEGSNERKGQDAAIHMGILQPPPKYTDRELVIRAVVSFYHQSLLLEGEHKDYCAVVATLLLVIFPSTNPDTLEMSARLLANLGKDPRFESYVRFVRGSVLDPIVKKRVSDISRFWNEILGTGVFGLSPRGFNYNNFHRTAEQICDMPKDGSHVTDLFFGFFLQWLPHRQKGLDFCASRWHKNAEASFGYAATLLFKGMK